MITLNDEREEPAKSETFFAKGGLISSSSTSTRTRSRCTRSRSTFNAIKDDVGIELAMQYNDGYNENIFSFVNNINTHEGGTHLTGFK